MKAYLLDGPLADMEVPITSNKIIFVRFGIYKYTRTGRTFAGLRVYIYVQ
jgi:hypothetical protein